MGHSLFSTPFPAFVICPSIIFLFLALGTVPGDTHKFEIMIQQEKRKKKEIGTLNGTAQAKDRKKSWVFLSLAV